jgi:hypothetical protein
MSSTGKHTRDVIKALRRHGIGQISVETTGKTHIRLRWATGSIVIACSPSCHRALINARADIRRALRSPSHHRANATVAD